jgi:single-stranded-DNA-specific exonuclease
MGIQIFEELGLLKCLGGTEKLVLEWIPAVKKLDLEASLRYRAAMRRREEFEQFRIEYQSLPWQEFIDKLKICEE